MKSIRLPRRLATVLFAVATLGVLLVAPAAQGSDLSGTCADQIAQLTADVTAATSLSDAAKDGLNNKLLAGAANKLADGKNLEAIGKLDEFIAKLDAYLAAAKPKVSAADHAHLVGHANEIKACIAGL